MALLLSVLFFNSTATICDVLKVFVFIQYMPVYFLKQQLHLQTRKVQLILTDQFVAFSINIRTKYILNIRIDRQNPSWLIFLCGLQYYC